MQWWFDLIANERGKPLVEQSSLGHVDSSGVWHESHWLRMMRVMDIVFVKERAYLSQYHDVGVNACWMDQACPSDMASIW